MYIDEQSRLSEVDHVEQSDKENDGPVKGEEPKCEPEIKQSFQQNFFCADENARDGYEDGCGNVSFARDVVVDSLDGPPSSEASNATVNAKEDSVKPSTSNGNSNAAFDYRLMVSGSIQCNCLVSKTP